MRKIWKAVPLLSGIYRWNALDGPHIGLTVKIAGPDHGVQGQREAGRLIDVPLTREEAEEAISRLTRAVYSYDAAVARREAREANRKARQ